MTRRPGAEWLFVWFAAVLVSLVHVSLLVWTSRHVAGEAVTYAVMAAPALILLVARPAVTIRRGYRWVAVWALTLTSVVSTPTLLIGQAWVLRQTWLESGATVPMPVIGALRGRIVRLVRPGDSKDAS